MSSHARQKDHVYKKRLLKLAELLEALPPKKFDYTSWATGKDPNECGTTACALGWACTIPSLRRAGLRLFAEKNFGGRIRTRVALDRDIAQAQKEKEASGQHYDRVFEYLDEYAPENASAEIFGVTQTEHDFLFIPEQPSPGGSPFDLGPAENATAKQVAKHIRKFVKAKYGKGQTHKA